MIRKIKAWATKLITSTKTESTENGALLLNMGEYGEIFSASIVFSSKKALGIPADVVILLDPDPSPEVIERYKENLSNSFYRKIFTLDDLIKITCPENLREKAIKASMENK